MSEDVFECPKCGGQSGYVQKKQIWINNNKIDTSKVFFDWTKPIHTPTSSFVEKVFCKNCTVEVEMFNKSLRERQQQSEKRQREEREKVARYLEREKRLAKGRDGRRQEVERNTKEKAERRRQELERQLQKKEQDPNFKVDPNLVKNIRLEQTNTNTNTNFGCFLLAVLLIGVVSVIYNLFN